ncbi:group II intron maturase-specific domain-containing protein [Gaoshiqia sp. Z1-71]|uniref:group II intron maturase-specific domain-containing protein n=1 Tax=Gaoshiqia hydrogeniformans TaxID=3290090 RepID=UPI003BF89984
MPTYVKGEKGKSQLAASEKSWKTLSEKLKQATRKTMPMSFGERVEKLKEITRGWLNYFRMAN